MWPSPSEQKSFHFSIREGEHIDAGTDNIEIAEFLLTQEVFTPGAEITCHFDLDRYYMHIMQAWAKVMK